MSSVFAWQRRMTQSAKMHFDELFADIGGMGPYQIYLSVLGAILSIWSVELLTTTFIAARLDHWCYLPALHRLSPARQKYVAIPRHDDVYEQCRRFDFNYSVFSDGEIDAWNRTARVYGDYVGYTACDDGWMYDFSTYESTAVNRFGLVCSRSWLVQFASTLVVAGTLMGAVTSGVLSDKIGRKKTMIFYLSVKVLGSFVSLFATNYAIFGVGRLLIGFGGAGTYVCTYVLVMELIGPHYRTHVGISYQIAFSFGMMLIPGIAYLVRNDRSIQIIFIVPHIVFLVYWFLLPESPRWLIVKGRYEEARAVLETVARINSKKLPEDIKMEDIKTGPDVEQTGTIIDLLRTPRMRIRTIVIYTHWFVDSLMYYGLSLNMADLSGDVFVNTFISGAVEVPANLLCIVLLNWPVMGRRFTSSLSLVAAGLSSFLCIPFILTNMGTPATVMAMLGKAFVTVGFSAIYVFSMEIFPTEVRNAGLGSSSTIARISGMAAPFIGGPMTTIWKPLPHVIFGSLASLAGFLALALPETLNQKLCDTVAEAEAFVGGGATTKRDITMPPNVEQDETNTRQTKHEKSNCSSNICRVDNTNVGTTKL